MLNVSTPGVSQNTSFEFAINVTISGDSTVYQKPVTINVIYDGCAIENWFECETSGQQCKQCDSGYEMIYGPTSCDSIDSSEEIEAYSYSTIAVLSVGITASVLVSLLTTSSPHTIWLMMNQYQLLILLPLTKAYIPIDVIKYILGMEFTLFNLNFMNFDGAFRYDNLLHDFSDKQTDWYKTQIGIKYQSAIVNHMSLALGLFFLVMIHLWVIITNCILRKRWSDWCFTKLISLINKYFSSGIYGRTILEAFQFIALWSTLEIYNHNANSTSNKISLSLAYQLLICWVLWIWIIIYSWIRKKKKGKSYDESLHNSLNYSRRLILVCIIMFWRDDLVVILAFTSVQIIYLIVMWVLRPLKSKKDTIIDLFNETIFSCLSASLIYFRTESAWNEIVEKIFIYTIMTNTLGVTIIAIVFLFVHLCQKRFKKKPNKVEVDTSHATFLQKIRKSVITRNNSSFIVSDQSFVGAQSKMDFYKPSETRVHSINFEENKDSK